MSNSRVVQVLSLLVLTVLPGVGITAELLIDSGLRLNGFQLGSTVNIVVGDVNNDGALDVYSANWESNFAPDFVWFGDGNGNFTRGAQLIGFLRSRVARLGDIDGDGDLDVVLGTDTRSGPTSNLIFLNNGVGNFVQASHRLGNSSVYALELADLDADGDLDAFIGTAGLAPNLVWFNDGSGVFTDSGQELESNWTTSLALGDLDGDGDIDALTGGQDNGAPTTIWKNDGTGIFAAFSSLGLNNTTEVGIADFDNDGDLDVFDGRLSGQNVIWLNDGVGNMSMHTQFQHPGAVDSVNLADMDDDGDIDILTHSSVTLVWLNDGNANFSTDGVRLHNGGTSHAGLGDFDGDGDQDVFVGIWRRNDLVYINTTYGDNDPPEIATTGFAGSLFPPNHKLVNVGTITVTDAIDPNPVVSIQVSSNQQTHESGDGNTAVDWEVIATGNNSWEIWLRAERAANLGADRVYTIVIDAVDASGNVAAEVIRVSVPHDSGK